MILALALVAGFVGLPAQALPFRSVGQVSAVPVPVIGHPLSFGSDSMGGAVSPNGKLACFVIAGVDYRSYSYVLLNLRTGSERPKALSLRQTQGSSNRPVVLTSMEPRTWPGTAEPNNFQDAPNLCTQLDDGRHLDSWTTGWLYPSFGERLLALNPIAGDPGKSVLFRERTKTPQLNVGGEPWRITRRTDTVETVEARSFRGRILLQRVRIDLRRKSTTRKPLGSIPAARGPVRFHPSAVSMDGSCALLDGTDVRDIGVGTRPGSKGGLYCWQRGRVWGPVHAGQLRIWRDRFIGYDSSEKSAILTTVEYTQKGRRVLATGWEWLATNPDGSKVLALQQATGKPYLLTFR
ncbi:MAG: hypothetical protein ACYC96_13110 [Fimbriimonadaceae bacterium]